MVGTVEALCFSPRATPINDSDPLISGHERRRDRMQQLERIARIQLHQQPALAAVDENEIMRERLLLHDCSQMVHLPERADATNLVA
jgi:hypothetical protein